MMKTITLKLLITVLSLIGFTISANAQDITAYSFAEQTGNATITAPNMVQNGKVKIEVAYGTNLNGLVATFTLDNGATAAVSGTAQESGVTPNDFVDGTALVYTVTASDGATTQDWNVIVSVSTSASTEAKITAYSFAEQTGNATITDPAFSGQNGTIDVEVAYGTDLTALVASFDLSYNASAKIANDDQTSGSTVNDFTNTVTYTVTAEDASTTVDWDVNVSIAPNTENDILAYSFAEQTIQAFMAHCCK